MSKRIALITGGMGGLGTAICKALAADGCIIVANCLPDFPQMEDWLAKTRSEGYAFHAAEGDVSDYESCTAMVKKIEAEIGPVDVLVNNAGITRDGMFRKMGKGDWDAVLATNLDSVFNVTHQVLAGMAERGWGRVINMSSVNGVKGQFGQANYSAAKAGILGFTNNAKELVPPGSVNVSMWAATPMGSAARAQFSINPPKATIVTGRMTQRTRFFFDMFRLLRHKKRQCSRGGRVPRRPRARRGFPISTNRKTPLRSF